MEATSRAMDKFVYAARKIKHFTLLPEWIYDQRISVRPDPSSLPWLNDLLKVRMKSLNHIDNPMYLMLLENTLSAEQLDHFMLEYYWGSGYGFQRLVLPEVQKNNGNAVWKNYIKGIILEENTPEPHHVIFRNYMLKLGIDAGQGNTAIPAAANEFNSSMLAGYKASFGYAMGYALGIETEADFQISLLYLACVNRDPDETLHDPYFEIHMAEGGEEAHARFTCECIEKMLEAGEISRDEIEEGFVQAIVDTRNYMRTIYASLPCSSDTHRDKE